MNRRKLGTEQEKRAVNYLQEQGYEIVEYNYHNRTGEIDIIARDGTYLVFVEVKYRSDIRMGSPLAAVDLRKQRNICRVARHYLMVRGLPDQPCRFDVVAVEGRNISLIKDAFWLT
ncbi:MAG: YraN family protein [Lachnospiraceae bacterium]|nr:YraN family protein [Lachnospiraceae bacterium]